MTQVLSLAPPGRIVLVPGRGEMFVRDSGPETARRGTLLLFHGWMFPADLNWMAAYGPLQETGYRVLAVDHRGHGRGIRSLEPFRFADCADDAAGLLRQLDIGPVLVVGYSMGGAVAQLMAQRHPDLVAGLVLCATTDQWREKRSMRVTWRLMWLLQRMMTRRPERFWTRLLGRGGVERSPELVSWIVGELLRGSPRDLAEAGREMARHDARSWIGSLSVPVAVICPTHDQLVPPSFQRRMAARIPGAKLYEVEGDHLIAAVHPERFVPALLGAIEYVGARRDQPGGAVHAETAQVG